MTQAVQYGPKAKGLATYYSQNQLIPYQRVQDIFRDVYSLPLSEGTLVNINVACYEKLADFELTIKQRLTESHQANFDESGMRVNQKLHWLHVASTEQLTHFEIHEKRGTEALEAIGILSQFKGRAMHDHWQAYFHYACDHGLCNAHHLRELTYHEEQYEQSWCQEMRECLLAIKREVERLKEASHSEMNIERIQYYEQAYDRILREGTNEIPALSARLMLSKSEEKTSNIQRKICGTG